MDDSQTLDSPIFVLYAFNTVEMLDVVSNNDEVHSLQLGKGIGCSAITNLLHDFLCSTRVFIPASEETVYLRSRAFLTLDV